MTIEIRTHRDLSVVEDIASRFGVYLDVDVTAMIRGFDEEIKRGNHINGIPLKKNTRPYKKYEYKKNEFGSGKSSIKPAMATNQRIGHLEKYLLEPEDKVHANSKGMSNWDKKPFDEDGWIFNDSDPDRIAGDGFEQIASHKFIIVEELSKKYPLGKWDKVKTTDSQHDWLIGENLKRATPNTLSPDLGQAGIIDQKFKNNQSARQIFEDCTYDRGGIKVPQLTAPGACSVPSHLKIEEMSKFIGITLKQAKILAKIYRILDLDFNTVAKSKIGKSRKTLNNHIRTFVQETGKPPWEIRVSKGLTLLKLAQEIKALMTEDQEDPEWAKPGSGYQPGNIGAMLTSYDSKEELSEYYEEYIQDRESSDDLAERNMWLSMSGEHYRIIYEDDKERQFEQNNPVGEYTYWRNSVIKTPDHLKGHNSREFSRLVSKISNFELSNQAIIKEGEWVKKKGTPSQKVEWKKLVRWVTSVRAMNNIEDKKTVQEKLTKTA
jgi:hypothetical protein